MRDGSTFRKYTFKLQGNHIFSTEMLDCLLRINLPNGAQDHPTGLRTPTLGPKSGRSPLPAQTKKNNKNLMILMMMLMMMMMMMMIIEKRGSSITPLGQEKKHIDSRHSSSTFAVFHYTLPTTS